MMKLLWHCLAVVPLSYAIGIPRTPSPAACSSAASSVDLNAFNARLLNATEHAVGAVSISNITNDVAFCELYFSIAYGTDNNDTLISALWLPNAVDYANRFMAVGNGGMAGTIDTVNMMTQLNAGLGFAVAGGDAGHSAAANNNGGGAPAVYLPYLHDPDQVEAWIHNAIALFTPVSRAIIDAYYGSTIKYSYYDGCSTGGAQGFALVQYHPELFDGVVAGSPGNWYSHLALSFLWNAQKTNVGRTASQTTWR
jgi:feruloyl esterase